MAVIACAGLLGAVFLAPSAGGAAATKVRISIGFQPEVGNPFFKGKVSSKRASCRSRRVVSVFRVINRRRVVRFRSTRSDSRGFWKIDMNRRMRPAGYYARVKPRAGCRLAKSKQIGVGQGGPGGTGPGGTE